MLEKRGYLILLFDFYGALLTDKQRLIFDYYYQDDLSLGEIAQEQGISRQAVYDIIKRTENTLEEYEKKLGLVNKFMFSKKKLKEIILILEDITDHNQGEDIQKIKGLINELLQDV